MRTDHRVVVCAQRLVCTGLALVRFTAAVLAAIVLPVMAQESGTVRQASSLPPSEAAAGVWPEVRGCWEQELRDLEDALERRARQPGPEPEPGRMADANVLLWSSDRDALDVVLRRTRALLSHLKEASHGPELEDLAKGLDEAARQSEQLPVPPDSTVTTAERAVVYFQVCALRRKLVYANPWLDFDDVLFVARKNAHPGIIQGNSVYAPSAGGGIYVASGFKSGRPRFRNLLENSRVQHGPLKGQTLHDQKGRSFQGLDLSYDGKEVVFAYADVGVLVPPPEVYNGLPCMFHLFRVNVDGAGLTQLTDGVWKDHSPCWLPNGRIVFCSERRQLSNRCSGLHDYEAVSTLFSIAGDGSDLIPISWHEADEINPSVDNDGMLVYTRWDYVDRDFSAAHHVWKCGPDGSNPRAPHANYPTPHHTFDGHWDDGRAKRPWAEQFIRAIPGMSGKYVAVATGHHTPPHGPLVLLDLNVPDDHRMSQVQIVTGDGTLPLDSECRGGHRYVCPWPLSDSYFLAAESETRKLFLIDRFGNRELLFEALVDLPIFQVLPLRPRPLPRETPERTFQGSRASLPEHTRAVISVVNVYESDLPWPDGTVIKALRIIEIFPREWAFPESNTPRIGFGSGANARMVLGVVPVEDDGSAYFEAPVGKAIYFQAIDERGMAVQSMRSCTYVHPGEHLSCLGCHEHKWKAPAAQGGLPKAFRRAPSEIVPEPEGSLPFSFARLVQPVLEAKCGDCHAHQQVEPPLAAGRSPSADASAAIYTSLEPYAFYFHGQGSALGLEPIHGGYRSIPGRFGARQSSLLAFLGPAHYGVQLTDDERRRLTLWLDLNSNELGAYHDADRQQRGEVVWPKGVNPGNPTGVERDRRLP